MSAPLSEPLGKRGVNVIEGAAASASLLCLVHCLALPVLIILLPGTLGLFAASEAFHYLAFLLVLPSAGAAFYLGYQRHRSLAPLLFGAVGATALALGLLPSLHDSSGAVILTVTGTLALLAGHVINWRRRSA